MEEKEKDPESSFQSEPTPKNGWFSLNKRIFSKFSPKGSTILFIIGVLAVIAILALVVANYYRH